MFAILEHSIFFKDQWLINKALNLIRDNGQVAVKSKPFRKLSFAAIGQVLDMETINAGELDIFEACMTWAWAECERQGLDKNVSNARQVLGDHLYKIRFSTMSLQQFADNVVPTGLLTTDEGYLVFQQFVCTEKPVEVPFQVTHRLGVSQHMFFLNNIYSEQISTYDGNTIVNCDIDEDVTLTHVYFHGLQKNDSQGRYVKLSVKVTQSRNVLYNNDSITERPTSHRVHASKYPFITVALNDGVLIKKGTFTIWIRLRVHQQSYGSSNSMYFLRMRSLVRYTDGLISIIMNSDRDMPLLGFTYIGF